MNVKRKRALTYATIALFNFSTGIGYAIVFPTIWNYIHERYGGTGAMLGLIISAYSISSFFSNPLLGLWADKTQNIKVILAAAVVMEIAGSLMYFLGIATWFLVLSRLTAGFGGGGGAAVLADITRTTSESERTPVLSVVVSFRHLGLVIGPALNMFLSKLNFSIGQFPVDKYTSPGLFMAALWIIVELVVLGMYYNLTVLKDDEQIEQLFPGYSRGSLFPPDVAQPGDMGSSASSVDVQWNSALTEPNFPYGRSEITAPSPHQFSGHNVPPELLNEFNDNIEVQKANISTVSCKNMNTPATYDNHLMNTHLYQSDEIAIHRPSVSNTMIESAERYIQSFETGGSRGNTASANQRKIRSWEPSLEKSSAIGQSPSQISSHPASLLEDRTNDAHDFASVTRRQRSSSEPFVGNSSTIVQPLSQLSSISTNLLKDRTHDTHGITSAGEGFIRDEVVVLLGLAFISSFSQTVLETVVTPFAQKYYSFNEMQNSLIYLFAGIEVILIYIAIKFCSRVVSDRVILLFGIIMMCIATLIPLTFVSFLESGGSSTLPYFIITVIIDLIGIASIVVCSASLLSKVTSKESQAFSQGLRRSMTSLGCVLGPLWGGAYLNKMYLLFSIPLAVSVFIGVLFICSFKRFKQL